MIRLWFSERVRKLLSGSSGQSNSPSPLRPGTVLHLEALEEREVMATWSNVTPSPLTAWPLGSDFTYYSIQAATASVFVGNSLVSTYQLDHPGFERLIADLQPQRITVSYTYVVTDVVGLYSDTIEMRFEAHVAPSPPLPMVVGSPPVTAPAEAQSGTPTPGRPANVPPVTPAHGPPGSDVNPGKDAPTRSPGGASIAPPEVDVRVTIILTPKTSRNDGNGATANGTTTGTPQNLLAATPESQKAETTPTDAVGNSPRSEIAESSNTDQTTRTDETAQTVQTRSATVSRAPQVKETGNRVGSLAVETDTAPRSVVAPRSDARTNGKASTPLRSVPAPTPVSLRTNGKAAHTDLSDGALLQRFVREGDQAAFTTLVQRHERLVLRVARRVLGDNHAAQDALQLTFMVLARKANTLDSQSPLTGWLYKVAYHLALRLRGVAAQQRRWEERAANGKSSTIVDDFCVDLETLELREVLREELEQLPEKYRTPLVLCYFDGCTHDEAARAIGLPRGSMAKRLAEGLERLRERLHVRGFAL
jgi:RNA polymerase sigma factor (sigma-70 family)